MTELPQNIKEHIFKVLEGTERLNSIFPEIMDEISRVLKWLDDGKIVITGTETDWGDITFQDNRADEEK